MTIRGAPVVPDGVVIHRSEVRFLDAAWRRYQHDKLALFGLLFAIAIASVALLAPQLAPYPYDQINPANALRSPSAQHLMGTDTLGRDMLSRIIFAARPMLIVGLLTQVAGVAIGLPLGLIAGYAGGILDWMITRLIDMFSALPWYLIVLYLVMVFSPSLQNLILALTISRWVGACRLACGMTLATCAQEYILAARVLGIPAGRIMIHHVLPQIIPLLIWELAAGIPTAVFAEAGHC